MRYIFSFFLFFLFASLRAQSEQEKLEKLLGNFPDVSFTKTSKPGEQYLQYNLTIQQPLDHQNLKRGYFFQSVILTHMGFERPTVMETQGYTLNFGGNEIEKILQANNLNIEHRFFGQSVPDSLQWEYLSYEQASADLHHINQIFRTIYKGNWVSTGVSKGGVAAIYYKYFYPNDVNATIPYVAPINNSLEDKRIYNFLDTIGSAECRNKIFDFQEFMLQHENEALEKLKKFSLAKNLEYNYIGGVGRAFEYSVLEYSFSFWQGGNNCAQIPINKNIDTYIEHLKKVSGFSLYSDKGIKFFEPHYYQAATEAGYYGYRTAAFKKELHFIIENGNPSAIFFTPEIVKHKPFNDSLLTKVSGWIKENGNNIIYIYGGIDTWSACRAILSDKVNSKIFLIPNAGHPEARIKNMPADMKKSFKELLEKFSSCNVDLSELK